jgi:preprotein translocase subunit YajC
MSGVPPALWLQAAPPAGGAFDFLVPMAAIMLIFYLLLIRPQQRRQKEHDKMLQSLQKGDRIVTSGGLHGEVAGASEDVLTVEIGSVKGERVRVKLERKSVERRLEKAKGDES